MSTNALDLTGRVYGKLTAVRPVGKGPRRSGVLWECSCSCGGTTQVVAAQLNAGMFTSCGCIRKALNDTTYENAVGTRCGRLVAVELLGLKYHNKRRIILCKCDCGNTKEMEYSRFTSDHVKSCGCLRKGPQAGRRKPASNSIYKYNAYRMRASSSGLGFNLSHEEFIDITSKPCAYCGLLPSNVSVRTQKKKDGGLYSYEPFIYNGIDRVDNSKGYISGNMVPCCKACNRAKMDTPVDDFLAWVHRVAQYTAAV